MQNDSDISGAEENQGIAWRVGCEEDHTAPSVHCSSEEGHRRAHEEVLG